MSRTVLVVHLTIAAGRREAFLDLARAHAERCVELEEGCLRFEVLVPEEQPDQVILVEVYADPDAVQAHLASPHMARYLETTAALVTDRQRIRCAL